MLPRLSLLDELRRGGYEASLITTFNAYLPFYEEVVRQPFGTVWDDSRNPSQKDWAGGINEEMDRLGVTGEVERDRWRSAPLAALTPPLASPNAPTSCESKKQGAHRLTNAHTHSTRAT